MHKDIHERNSAARNVDGEVKLLHEPRPRADRPENKGTMQGAGVFQGMWGGGCVAGHPSTVWERPKAVLHP